MDGSTKRQQVSVAPTLFDNPKKTLLAVSCQPDNSRAAQGVARSRSRCAPVARLAFPARYSAWLIAES
jgi:hypothetical protein